VDWLFRSHACFYPKGFFKLSFEVEQVTVSQLGTDDLDNNGDNNGEGGNNRANGDNVDGAKGMDIERTMNNDKQGNANGQQGTVKKVNNAKSVVTHQVQHQVEVPIVFVSLNKALLNKGIHPNNSVATHIIEHCSSSIFTADENGNFTDPNPISHVETGNNRVGTTFDVDTTPGSVQIMSVAASEASIEWIVANKRGGG
jgi:hypothetical protein